MKIVNILVLEDDPNRVSAFRDGFSAIDSQAENSSVQVTFCTEAQQAIEAIEKTDFDLICLDHDLGGKVYVDSANKNTGGEVARFISKHAERVKHAQIIIHSLNTSGADYMQALMPHSRRMPFIWEQKRLVAAIRI